VRKIFMAFSWTWRNSSQDSGSGGVVL